MTSRSVIIALFTVLALGSHAAESASAQEKTLTPAEAAKARMRAEAKKAASPGTAPATAGATKQGAATNESTAAPKETLASTKGGEKKQEKEVPPPPTVMPKVEVRNSRITELDQKIAKQEQAIAREKENTKSTETDRALNDPKVSRIFSLFGGESSEHRAGIAQERVSLMEAEKDILEAMKTARTKEEKAELQKQLDELKAYRRELEKSLR